ncbi:MAG TPA: NAD-dependent deacylase [Candidatus Xenobia bacterium]|nr:NAD-dependent deacylase [Candidatus Xenobia bacterium]
MTTLATVQQWLAEAERIAVLTGAGISRESGLPTFRGAEGLWRQRRPEQLATPEAFARDPLTVWQWYDWRRSVIATAQPNSGHYALAELEKRTPIFTLITQNVDGLHDRADSRHLLKLHGDIWVVRCTGCEHESVNRDVPLPELPPRCRCGAMLRPGVVWFGEALPEEALRQSVAAAERAQVFLVVGTSGVVQPAATLPLLARRAGARVVEINPEETPLAPMADASFHGPSGELLPQLVAPGVRS